MRNVRASFKDGAKFEAHVRAAIGATPRTEFHYDPFSTPIIETATSRQTDPVTRAIGARDWYNRLFERTLAAADRAASLRKDRQDIIQKLERGVSVALDDVEAENRANFAGDENSNVAKFLGKAADNLQDALGKFAAKYNVDSPFWTMLRDTLKSVKATTIGDLDEGAYRFADYLIGRICQEA